MVKHRPASIRKAGKIRIGDERVRLGVCDDLSRLIISDGLWRVFVFRGNYNRFLFQLRVSGRGDDRTVLEIGAGVRPRRDLLIILLRRQSRVMLHCFWRILVLHHWNRLFGDGLDSIRIGAVIYRDRTLAFWVGHCSATESTGPLRLLFGDARWFGGIEMRVGEPGDDPDEHAELDRNKINNFQVQFRHAPLDDDKIDGNQIELFLQSPRTLPETARPNNLKIWEPRGARPNSTT